MKTAGIYTRISIELQSQFSLSSQREACEKLAREKAYATSADFIFVDDGGSSLALDRPGLTQLREAARTGVIQVLIVHDLDRLSRKLSHQLLLLEEFARHGVAVEFVNGGPNDSTPEGKLFLSMRGAVSEFEREKIRERTMRGSHQRAKEGKANAVPPFGYLTQPDGTLVAHPQHAAIVKKIFAWTIEGLSSSEIAVRLNADGVPAPRRSTWIRGTVLGIARRGAYASGMLAWNKTYAAEPTKRRKAARPGKSTRTSFRRRPESDWISIPATPLVDRTTFEQAQQAIDAHRRSKSGRPSRTFMLTGLIRCGRCGASICGSFSHGWCYYRCSRTNPITGKRSCGQRGIRIEGIEKQIWADVTRTVSNKARLAALVNNRFAEAAAKEADHEAERQKLNAHIEKLARREYNCRRMLEDSDFSDAFEGFRHDLKAILTEKRELQQRLESIRPVTWSTKPGDFAEFCRQMKAAQKITDRGRQRDFLRACVEEIRLSGEEVDIRFSLSLRAALAAMEPVPGGNGSSGLATNCQERQRAKINWPAYP
jgi:site-specific DNA recombinase